MGTEAHATSTFNNLFFSVSRLSYTSTTLQRSYVIITFSLVYFSFYWKNWKRYRFLHVVYVFRVITARCYASAVLAMGMCLSVRLSVRHKSVFYRNGWTNRAGFWHLSFLPPVLHRVKRKFGYFQNKGTSFWNFVQNSGLRKFRHGIYRRNVLST